MPMLITSLVNNGGKINTIKFRSVQIIWPWNCSDTSLYTWWDRVMLCSISDQPRKGHGAYLPIGKGSLFVILVILVYNQVSVSLSFALWSMGRCTPLIWPPTWEGRKLLNAVGSVLPVTRWLILSSAYKSWQSMMVSHRAVWTVWTRQVWCIVQQHWCQLGFTILPKYCG